MSWLARTTAALVLTGTTGFTLPATAQAEGDSTAAPPAPRTRDNARPPAEPEQPPLPEDSERPVPDYDGRADGTTFAEGALWVPRILFSPLYLVSEFIIRRPLGWLVTKAEEEELPTLLVDFFTFGPERNAGIIPTGLIDFGFRPSVGLYFFWNDFIAKHNDLRVRGATGGTDWWLLTAADRIEVMPEHQLALRGEISIRPDWIFDGLGPESQRDNESRFRKDQYEGRLSYEAKLWRTSSFKSWVGVRDASFKPSTSCCDDPSVADSVAAGRFPAPTGLADGYTLAIQSVEGALDTRPRRHLQEPRQGSDFVSPPGSGLRLDLRGSHAAALRGSSEIPAGDGNRYHFVNYGATLGGYLDLSGEQRVLGLSLIADFSDPLGDVEQIPVTEQISLGGERPMRGFLEGRLVDRSSAVAMFEYRWPVWVWLDGAFHYAVGNVFGEHLDGFSSELLRQSFGLGLRVNSSPDHAFELLVAAGTETFEDGSDIDTVRLVLGATNGF